MASVTQQFDGGSMTFDTDDPAGTLVISWDAGTPTANRQAQLAKLAQARAAFRANAAGWPNLTAAQKDAANRLAQRAVSNLIAYVLNDLSDAGD